MKYGYSKLCPKDIKRALESSFYLKMKKDNIRLIGMVGIIEDLFTTLSPSSNSRRCFKKSWDHCFCDNLEIVILSFDLHLLLKDILGMPEVKPSPSSSAYLRNTSEFSKITKNRIQSNNIWHPPICQFEDRTGRLLMGLNTARNNVYFMHI